ncbi:paired amphipathic helix protein Sin3a-like isoform X2 [Rhizophagus clarus]|uniref:Paired amphipathic helix protein Sin3a-like isoform X2 n=1 Tax=Rhizophagus clarus TaxID=94130 RepID=A0A8H3MD88_9GLOM|nr:paired amphipathic helix protein Sin3a-like isoform X2 [Rhizophagus clarus]
MSHQNLKREKGIEIALAYLREVKNRCKKPKIFNEFCETMRSFKRKEISESFCHDIVKNLFKDDPELLEGFYIYFPRQKNLLISPSSTTCITSQQREVEEKNDVLIEVDNKENNDMNIDNIDNQNLVIDNIENDNKLNFQDNDFQSHIIINNEGEENKMIINQELESENFSNVNQGIKKESSDLSTVISNSSFSPSTLPQNSFKNIESCDDNDDNNNIALLKPSSSTKKKEITSSPASNSLETGLRRSTLTLKKLITGIMQAPITSSLQRMASIVFAENLKGLSIFLTPWKSFKEFERQHNITKRYRS